MFSFKRRKHKSATKPWSPWLSVSFTRKTWLFSASLIAKRSLELYRLVRKLNWFVFIHICSARETFELFKFIKEGDSILVSQKSVGTLVLDDLNPGKRLYLFSTGTGLAPFMSIIRDPETYEKFEKIILVHGVRVTAELAYSEYLKNELPKDEFLGDEVSSKLIYYPTVTREAFTHKGRLTTAIKNGTLFADTKLPQLDPEFDRAMICGSPEMLKETSQILDDKGFKVSAGLGRPGDYVIERAFVGEWC